MATRFLVMLGFAACAGCGPIALQHGARPIAREKTVTGAGTSVVYEAGQGAAKDESFVQIGQSTAFARYGFGDRYDAGLQVFTGGVRIDTKYLVWANDVFAISVDPAVHFGYDAADVEVIGARNASTVLNAGLDGTLIAGMRIGDGELFVAPRFGIFSIDVASESFESATNINGTVNARGRAWGLAIGWRLPMKDAWIIPELGIYQRELTFEGDTTRGLVVAPTIGIATGF